MIDFSKLVKNRSGALPQGDKVAKKPAAKGKGDFDNTNRGVLFQNDKDGNEARPDFTGEILVKLEDFEANEDGMLKIRLAAWRKDSPKVGEYLSLSASAPQAK